MMHAYIWVPCYYIITTLNTELWTHYYVISFWCRRFHGLLLTICVGPWIRTALVATDLDDLDLLWMIGEKLEL
jgi:hypothetical protein